MMPAAKLLLIWHGNNSTHSTARRNPTNTLLLPHLPRSQPSSQLTTIARTK